MSPNHHNALPDILRAEKTGWEELESLVGALTPEQAEIPGYVPGWSVKDLLAHVAGWLSEAGRALQLITLGTYVEKDVDVDARNGIFVEANRHQPLSVVLFEAKAARRRLLHHVHGLAEIPPAAAAPLHKAGPEHYNEHLPRLREWVTQLAAPRQSSEQPSSPGRAADDGNTAQ